MVAVSLVSGQLYGEILSVTYYIFERLKVNLQLLRGIITLCKVIM